MDGIDIVYRLRRLGISQADIARNVGVSASVVGNVIHDRITSFGIASHVATLLGSSAGDLWPQRYTFKPRGRSPRRRGESASSKEPPVS